MATAYSSSRFFVFSRSSAIHLETLHPFLAAWPFNQSAVSSGNVMVMFFIARIYRNTKTVSNYPELLENRKESVYTCVFELGRNTTRCNLDVRDFRETYPPAIAGMIDTTSPSLSFVPTPSRNLISSSLT